ncbi:RING-finger domain-containing protein [Aspergillus fumigatus Z5]|nr:RING-finger domain-containing protein [Aspergillus fumigatus Z5]
MNKNYVDPSMRSTPKRRLEHLDEAAPVKSLQQWQASWCSEESPLLSKDNPLTCTICLEEVLTTQPVHCLGCRHVLHCWCLEKWFLRFHNTCPSTLFEGLKAVYYEIEVILQK